MYGRVVAEVLLASQLGRPNVWVIGRYNEGNPMKKFVTAAVVSMSVAAVAAIPAVAAPPTSEYNPHAASVNNTNANEHACWGQDRSYYASESFFGANMDIKQSFPRELGKLSEQRAAWIETYCPAP
jgi:hypothetical protein